MKKLSLIMSLLFWFSMFANVYANDLADLEKLLNSESTNTPATSENTADTATESTGTETTSSSTSGEKIEASLTWDVKTNSISLTFKKLPEYTEYKVYYSKTSDTELSEKAITATEEDVVVEIDWLEAETSYQFVVKAFDLEWNPISSTESEPLELSTIAKAVVSTDSDKKNTEQSAQHAAATDNIIYNPVIKSSDNKINISYKLGSDVKKVQIAISEDAKTFTPVVTLPASQTSYVLTTKNAGRKYLKLVPIDAEGELWICKIWKTTLKANIIPVENPEIGKPKTWPAMYLLIMLAMWVYAVYAIRKARA